jgi:oligopeptide transport system permease protein
MRWIIKRLFSLIVTLFVIVSFTFVLMKAIPGDPFVEEGEAPQEVLDALRRHYGLDDPWHVQYGRYLVSIIKWDLGPSFKYQGRTVNEIIRSGFPVSAVLGVEALFIALFFGISIGIVAALYQNRWPDYLSMSAAIVGISVPNFMIAAALQYFLAVKWGLFPVARWGTAMHTILPVITLAALPTAFIARLMRSSMLEVLRQDYIRTAFAKGLSRRQVILRHALRNACLPILSYLGQIAAGILSGSFIVEKIFGIPGLGQWFVTSVANRDYTVIMGTTVFYSILLLSAVCLVDIIYSLLDRRIALQWQERLR